MALNFPTSPTEGDPHNENGQTWIYNGGAWVLQATYPINEAPATPAGSVYVRSGETQDWVLSDNIEEAPTYANPNVNQNSYQYVRNGEDGTWESLHQNLKTGFKNALINPHQKVNQRGFTTWANVAEGEFGPDRWFKNGGQKIQYVEKEGMVGNVWTLSWSGGGTGQVGSSPVQESPITFDIAGDLANGHLLVSIPQTAYSPMLEHGPRKTNDEFRPMALETLMCQRYMQRAVLPAYSPRIVREDGQDVNSGHGAPVAFRVPMRTLAPSHTWLENPQTVWRAEQISGAGILLGDLSAVYPQAIDAASGKNTIVLKVNGLPAGSNDASFVIWPKADATIKFLSEIVDPTGTNQGPN